MSQTVTELLPYLTILTPPLLGAFIGYLTNRVAIRMLFRPLKPWYVGPVRIPMTPGVIPSKRHELAVNIGEMVGEHLLTSEEINRSLKKDAFQEHLYRLIESKVGTLMKQDLGSLPSLVPKEYKSYFDIAQKTVTYQMKETVHDFVKTPAFTGTVEGAVNQWLDSIMSYELSDVLSRETRNKSYELLKEQISRMCSDPQTEKWLETFIHQKAQSALNDKKSLGDVLPPSLQSSIIELIEKQTPHLLDHGLRIINEPDVQEKIISAIRQAIEAFIETLGPMASMVQNFLDMDMVEEKIRTYFSDKQDDIESLLNNEQVRNRVSAALTDRTKKLFTTPLDTLFPDKGDDRISAFSRGLTRQILSILQSEETSAAITRMLSDNIEHHIEDGNRSIQEVAEELFGTDGISKSRKWLSSEIISLLQSSKTQSAVDKMLETMVEQLLAKPVGRLANLIPAGVRIGLYRSLQSVATKMLVSEVPGIVKSLNIRQIVTERVDSFDLLRLEGLLLSIMEEQFKYINLFGGLLGFIIGCANLILILGTR